MKVRGRPDRSRLRTGEESSETEEEGELEGGRKRGAEEGYRRGRHPRNPPTDNGTAEKSSPRDWVKKGVRRVTDWWRDRGKNGRRVKMRRSCGPKKEEDRQREGQ